MYRVEEETVRFLPKIPAQPIGYAEAQVFLQYVEIQCTHLIRSTNVIFRYMQGEEVEEKWRGSLENVTYRYGGDLISTS